MLKLCRPVFYICGVLTLVIAGLMLIPTLYAALHEQHELRPFLAATGITAVIGLILVNLYTVMSRDMFPDVLDNVVNFQLLVGGILICMVTV